MVEVSTPGPDCSMRPMPKPQTSCTLVATDGMDVKTQHSSEVADKAQHGMIEFLLINHPLDCPTCDKGGECPLQNQAMSNGNDLAVPGSKAHLREAAGNLNPDSAGPRPLHHVSALHPVPGRNRGRPVH